MNRFSLIKPVYFLTLATSIFATWSKLQHQPYAATLFGIVVGFFIVFIILAALEIIPSKRIGKSEKIMWIVGLAVMTTIVGFIYLLSARKRVLDTRRQSIDFTK